MKKEKKDKDFIKSPYFPGGRQGIEAFVRKALQYPEAALRARVEGTVTVRYTVDYKGHVIHATIVSGIGHGCDEEALRIVRLMKFAVPEEGRIKSKYSRKLHIHFRLSSAPAAIQSSSQAPGIQEIRYTLSPTPPEPENPKPSGSITYTITFTRGEQKK